MTAPWRLDPASQVYTVTHFDRGRGAHSPLHSMAGPEFTGLGAVYSPLGLLPPTVRIAAFAVILLIGMAGCTAAMVDYQHYTPSPNICRSANSGVTPEKPGSCVPASRVPEVRR
ncbi:hypothetical protein [Nocardia vinacea]|uniref:hypothetical protein n=1 Tax=Nocardia vinacea TaxID=96468 RepID=UPI0002D3756C|nr:hypothetical protein [Nocardia vinacea]